jgi:hypothetical protein
MVYYVLIKKKGSSKWLGALPSKRGVSLLKLRKNIRRTIKKNVDYKIISENKMRTLIKKKKRK